MLATGARLPWLFDYAGPAAWPWAWIGSGGICIPLSIAAIIAMRTIAEPSASGGNDAWPWQPCLPEFNAYFRSVEHTSELQPLMRNMYAVLWMKKKKTQVHILTQSHQLHK